jgi:DnaJ family protein C protein 28
MHSFSNLSLNNCCGLEQSRVGSVDGGINAPKRRAGITDRMTGVSTDAKQNSHLICMPPTSIRPLLSTQPSLPRRIPNNGLKSLAYTQHARFNHSSARSDSEGGTSGQASASAKLFADAAREEAEDAAKTSQPSSRLAVLEQQHPNWTGDESIEDAVLRMLVDKYKPLRTGTIQTAEEKIKQHPPKLAPAFGVLDVRGSTASSPPATLAPTTGSWATETLLPAKEHHQPWHTEFKAPSTDTSSVKLARLPPPISPKKAAPQPLDDHARRRAREEKKRTQQAGRLTQAREMTLDYRLGIKGTQISAGMPNPTSVKGWNSLIEDKIEVRLS